MRIEGQVLREWLVPACWITAFLGAQKIGGPIALASQIALVPWALTSSRGAMQSLSLIWLAGMISPYLVPSASLWYARQLKWAILIAAATRVGWMVLRERQPLPRMVIYLLIFVLAAGFSSVVASFDPGVSLSKLVAFLMGSCTVILAFSQMRQRGQDFTAWLVVLSGIITVASVPLVVSPLGYKYVWGASPLFHGLLLAPQEFAVFLSPLVGWLGARVVVGRATAASAAALAALGYLLIVSGSRTGIMAAFGSLALVLTYAVVLRYDWRLQVVRAFARPMFIVLLAATGLVAVSQADAVAGALTRLVYKRASTVSGEFQASRGFLVDEQMDNFRRHPLFGIGFGMPSNPHEYQRSQATVLGIPLGAPTEKGLLPTAVIEETGIVGSLAFLGVLAGLLAALGRTTLPSAVMAAAVLLNNLGEANFFAFGGMGLYYWLVLGLTLWGTPPEPAPAAAEGTRERPYATGAG